MEADEFHVVWFGSRGGPPGAAKRFWEKDPAFDALLHERYGELHRAVAAGEREAWKTQARACAAYVTILDQLSRNIFRGRKEAFASDVRAQSATLEGMASGLDRELDPVERRFFYMPLLHAEDLKLQDQGVIAFATLAAELPDPERGPVISQVISAAKHRAIVLRFGRFPHRNAVLGRDSTSQELAFLREPGSSF
jgi:uncharacterized protein (DUF924 family)